MFSIEKKSCKRKEEVSTEESMLEKGKNRRENKKKERGEIESAGIPLKVVVKVVRLVPEEKKKNEVWTKR